MDGEEGPHLGIGLQSYQGVASGAGSNLSNLNLSIWYPLTLKGQLEPGRCRHDRAWSLQGGIGILLRRQTI
jgi:hypothetical protein